MAQRTHARALLLAALMIFSTTLAISPLLSTSPDQHWAAANGVTTQFNTTYPSVDLRPNANESTLIPHVQGTRITGATVDINGGPVEKWGNSSFNASSPLFANGTFQQTTLGSSGIELSMIAIASNGSIPGVGTQNMTVLNQTTWSSGTYSFDRLRVQCGFVGPCGNITADGPITIIANEIIITAGGSIHADANTWGGRGQGDHGLYGYTSPMGPVSSNHGGGGAGHGGDGGDGGNAGTANNRGQGGSAYGNGSESGSSGGNISNFGNGVRAVGGRGGGQLTFIARTITISGVVSADAEDGQDGASLGNGSGPGNHGAGGGSGGGITIQAHNLSVSSFASLRALGGDGGHASAARGGPAQGWGPNNAGGHGGGGGGGGRISIITLANGYSNQGSVSVSHGGGGNGGAGSGSGSAGTAGANGTTGVVNTSSFLGWGGISTVPGAGNQSLNLTTGLTLSGIHSYDVLHLKCQSGTGGSCGNIRANGPLKIIANQITLDYGTSITSNFLVWGGSGIGGSGSQGNSPYGAGGGGHRGAGGNGGGTGGPNIPANGGSAYGNGTQSGSSGGNVTGNNPNGTGNQITWYGGKGGGMLELVGGSITISGTVSSDGGDGANGPSPRGGPGYPGAGGGSGGSIYITARTLTIQPGGVLRALGGDGGDGSNAVSNALPFTKNGGDGGGGGGGGRITIITLSNGHSNQGTISVTGGSGGAYGTGIQGGNNGRAGSAGATGVIVVNTFTGFSGGLTYVHPLIGSWTTQLVSWGEVHHWMNYSFGHSTPVGTSIAAEANYSLDGTNFSGWTPIALVGVAPPFGMAYLRFWFNTTDNSTTPILNDISWSRQMWLPLDNLSLSVTGRTGAAQIVDWGPLDQLYKPAGWNGAQGPGPQFWDQLVVPLNGNPTDFGWLHYGLLQSNGVGTLNISVAGTQLLSMPTADIQPHGVSIQVPQALLAQAWPTTGVSDSFGVVWGTLLVNRTLDNGTSMYASWSSVPYETTVTAGLNGELASAIDRVANASGGFENAVHLVAFKLIVSGDSDDPDRLVTLENLNVTWVDDLPPQLVRVHIEVGGVTVTDPHVNDIITIVVTEATGEIDLTVECLLSSASNSTWFENISLTWKAARGAYTGTWDTSGFHATTSLEVGLEVLLTDSALNSDPSNGDDLAFTLLPTIPVVSTLTLTSTSGGLGGDPLNSRWSHVEKIVIAVSESNSRADLEATLRMTRRESGTVLDIPLVWGAEGMGEAYAGRWQPGRYAFGVWDIEVLLVDVGQLEWDDDGLKPGADGTITILDLLAPQLVSVSFDWSPTNEAFWRTTVEWSAESSEIILARVEVTDSSGAVVANVNMFSPSAGNGYADWDTTNAEPGRYELDVFLEDNAGNSAPDWLPGPDGVMVIEAPRVISLEVLEPVNWSEFGLGDKVAFRLVISCSDGCLMSIDEEGLEDLASGTVEFNRTMTEVGELTQFITLRVGELTVSEMVILQVLVPPDPLYTFPSCSQSSLYDANMTDTGHHEFVCSVDNMGSVSSPVRARMVERNSMVTCSPTTMEIVNGREKFESTCRTEGEVEKVNEVTSSIIFEWQDHLGGWHRIGSEQWFNTTLQPELDEVPTTAVSSVGDAVSPIAAIAALVALFIIGLATALFVRRRGREPEFDLGAVGHVAEQSLLESPASTEESSSQTEEHTSSAPGSEPKVSSEGGSGWASSYGQLPPGGRYEQVPEGMWYIDAEGSWWWNEDGDNWRRV